MDDIAAINFAKDSTLALLLELQARGHELYYFEQINLFLRDGSAYGNSRWLQVKSDPQNWFVLEEFKFIALAELDIILMRKDPPFNAEYIYTTYILEQAERDGVLVVNRPQSLRDANEKLFASQFPQCTPPTLVAQSCAHLYNFWQEYGDIVCKPLHNMGGTSIFRITAHDVNANVIFTTLTENETIYIMAQQFLPAIRLGDKRLLMINGKPIPYVLARIPAPHDWRGNLAVGATAKVQELSERDYWIAEQIGPSLRVRGLWLVGLDIIGDYLTEINVTSPTCLREISTATNINIAALAVDALLNL